ncbi:helix-turn-helix domain-containing protein [Caulobacter sp. RL271]|uniref:Helix-turn-helix domain-containing protein n=1 Tax=Caulobacter segnis TaxID=88688 RepID=A0ABY4ZS27_9CAUL|nr:helix-turn-helix transcriptional regulator [Caulobacter segnis]USQ95305.1 helix-turn-helix domain-containing protein [Caulobacter segnis]
MADIQDERDPVDVFVGARVRALRRLRDLSQLELSRHLGVSFQQIQKYETAANRISASMLHRIAALFDVPVGALFDGAPSDDQRGVLPGPADPAQAPGVDVLVNTTGGLGLAEAFLRLPPALRAPLVDVAQALVKLGDVEPTSEPPAERAEPVAAGYGPGSER